MSVPPSDAPRPARSTAGMLAWVWAGVIVYASLFPFEGWRWPPGVAPGDLLRLPWPRYFIPFDIVSNLAGYAPLGLLITLAGLRRGASWRRALIPGLLAGALLSGGLELIQHLLPGRVPSSLDWLLNAAGALLGAVLAGVAARGGGLRAWDRWRNRWVLRGHGGALALLALWPVALVYPPPSPFGLGRIGPALQRGMVWALEDVPWARPVLDALTTPMPAALAWPGPVGATVLCAGLLAPCLLACAASTPGRRRGVLLCGIVLAGVAASTLSSVINYGPAHPWAWAAPGDGQGLMLVIALLLPLAWLPSRLAGLAGLACLLVLVLAVHALPLDPYGALNEQSWEQGRFIRFHGLTPWLAWLWPYGAMAWLSARLARP